ncbi:uncharacterized protein LOC144167026 isoform X1 [Haemaphysalis longicornis]
MWRHPVRQSADPAAAETGPDESSAFTGIQFTYGFEVQTNMTRTPCTSMYSAVLLSLLLAVVVGSPTQPARNIPDPSKGMQPVGATQADLLSHEEPDGVMVVKGNHVRSGKKVSRRSYAALSKPQVDKFLPQVPVARHFPGYFAKHMPCQNETSGCRVILPADEADNYSPQQHPSKLNMKIENEQLMKFEKNVTRRVGAIDVKLAKLLEEFDSQKNKVVEIGHQLNRFNDALKEKLRAATASTLQSVESKAREVKALLNEKTESMTRAISSGLSMVAINPKTHRWTLTGYAGHKAEAIKRGWEWEMGEKVYIQHYLISWGIEMRAEDGHVNLYLLFQFHKGRYDEFLDWPFSNELKLCLIHPETQKEHCANHKPNLDRNNIKFFARPLKDSNSRACAGSAKFESSYIEENGYTMEDKLFLKFEVLT